MSDCNNTPIDKLSENIKYDGPALACSSTDTCDDLNTIFEKINSVSCNLIDSVSEITETVNTLTENVNTITQNIVIIFNQLEICCPICEFTGTANELPVCNFNGSAEQLPNTTTTTTTEVPTTTTTTTNEITTTTTTTINPFFEVIQLIRCTNCAGQPTTANALIPVGEFLPGEVIKTSEGFCWTVGTSILAEPSVVAFWAPGAILSCAICTESGCPDLTDCNEYEFENNEEGTTPEISYIDCNGDDQTHVATFGITFVCGRKITSIDPYDSIVYIYNNGTVGCL